MKRKLSSNEIIFVIVIVIILYGIIGLLIYHSVSNGKISLFNDKKTSSYEETSDNPSKDGFINKIFNKNNGYNEDIDSDEFENQESAYNTDENYGVNNTDDTQVRFTPEYFSFRDSSRLSPGNGFTYYPENLVDNDPVSCWSEGVSGSGIGESIGISYKNGEKVSVSRIKIMNGCCESEKVYYYNNRIKEIRLYLDNVDLGVFTLSDVYKNYQVIDLGKSYDVKDISLKIESVYNGSKFNDTCISELRLE